jgi:hypothetical protein
MVIGLLFTCTASAWFGSVLWIYSVLMQRRRIQGQSVPESSVGKLMLGLGELPRGA